MEFKFAGFRLHSCAAEGLIKLTDADVRAVESPCRYVRSRRRCCTLPCIPPPCPFGLGLRVPMRFGGSTGVLPAKAGSRSALRCPRSAHFSFGPPVVHMDKDISRTTDTGKQVHIPSRLCKLCWTFLDSRVSHAKAATKSKKSIGLPVQLYSLICQKKKKRSACNHASVLL